MKINVKVLFICLFLPHMPLNGMSLPQTGQPLSIAFATSIEFRKTQLIELEKKLTILKKREDDTKKLFEESLKNIAIELTEAQQLLQKASENDTEFIHKKISVLNDRKQNIFEIQELWRIILDDVVKHSKFIEYAIETLQKPNHQLKPAYSWNEFRDAQMIFSEFVARLESEKNLRENIKKQKTAFYEKLTSLEKQYENIKEEHDKLIFQLDRKKPTNGETESGSQLKFKGENLAQELEAVKEKIEHNKLLIEKLDIENKYWDDAIEFNQQQLAVIRERLAQIENRLILDYNDIELAKNEWRNEVQQALNIKEELNQQREPKKQEKEKVLYELDILNKKLDNVKGKNGRENLAIAVLKTEQQRLNTLVRVIEQEFLLLDAKKDLAETLVNEKELLYNMIDLRYKMQLDIDNLNSLLSAFQNKRDLALSQLKTFKDMRAEAIASLIETNQALDRIKASQEKIHPQNGNSPREQSIRTVYNLFDETKIFLNVELNLIQSLLAVNAELLAHQEKIINQYNLLTNDLETRYKKHTIWKRSPRAISYDALSKSLLEAEGFFTKLFWETPNHIKPTALWTSLTSYTPINLLYILFLLLILLFLFFLLRISLRLLLQKISAIVDRYQGRTRFLYLHLALVFLNLIADHFFILFIWGFFLWAIAVPTNSLVASLVTITPYHEAIFYLISVGILFYLTRHFIEELKDLNKRLSFFFFAETFQNKFITLVTALSYATVILLPLRHALLAYMPATFSDFATVVLAAYSLTVLIVLLFFFGKEDVLKFVPSHNTFFIWLKRKIDKHYYQVFLFFVSLLILSNPYIGYSNMAWFLAFAIPSTGLLLFALFKMHYLIRKYSIFLFMKEDDEDFVDKFEHAKAYYGFFVIFSFVLLLFFTALCILRIWGFDYSPFDIWKGLAEQWVIRIPPDNRLGIIELSVFVLFIVAGFMISSLLHKFVLARLFSILRSEPGTQNTISRMCHYLIVFLAITLGFTAIHLENLILWVGASLTIGLGFALKDIAADLLAGFVVLVERPIEIGNYVQIDNIQGTVHKIAGRSTTIITSRNHSIIIPNKDLVTKWIVNWGHGRFAVGLEMAVRVLHKSDPELVKKTLVGIIQSNPFILKVPNIVVRLEDIEENALYFLVRAFVSSRRVKEQWDIAAALRTEIIKAFAQQGIQFSQPTRLLQFSAQNNANIDDGKNDGFKAIEIKFDKP